MNYHRSVDVTDEVSLWQARRQMLNPPDFEYSFDFRCGEFTDDPFREVAYLLVAARGKNVIAISLHNVKLEEASQEELREFAIALTCCKKLRYFRLATNLDLFDSEDASLASADTGKAMNKVFAVLASLPKFETLDLRCPIPAASSSYQTLNFGSKMHKSLELHRNALLSPGGRAVILAFNATTMQTSLHLEKKDCDRVAELVTKKRNLKNLDLSLYQGSGNHQHMAVVINAISAHDQLDNLCVYIGSLKCQDLKESIQNQFAAEVLNANFNITEIVFQINRITNADTMACQQMQICATLNKMGRKRLRRTTDQSKAAKKHLVNLLLHAEGNVTVIFSLLSLNPALWTVPIASMDNVFAPATMFWSLTVDLDLLAACLGGGFNWGA